MCALISRPLTHKKAQHRHLVTELEDERHTSEEQRAKSKEECPRKGRTQA